MISTNRWTLGCAALAWLAGCGDESGNDGAPTSTGGRANTGGASAETGGSANSGGSGSGTGGASAQGGSNATGGKGMAIPGDSPVIEGCAVFPADNPWNLDVSALPLHENSDAFVDSIGRDDNVHPDFGTEWEGAPIGIPFVTVDESQPVVPIDFVAYGDESDEGPYPVPPDAPVEGGPDSDGDRHVLVLQTGSCMLYELYRAFPVDGGASWEADSGAVFDLGINDEHPWTYTSADAAGLPILPGLVRYEEVVEEGELRHAVRMTVSRSQAAIVAPARHYASSSDDPNLPPMGLRLRMKADYDCSGFSAEAAVVCAGLKRFGAIVADNGSSWYISGAPDPRWDDDALGDLKTIPGDAFEVVETGAIETY